METGQYVLIVSECDGTAEIYGLHPNNEQTWSYIKQLLLNHVQEFDKNCLMVPEEIGTLDELVDWYNEEIGFSSSFFRVGYVTPEHAPTL